MKDGLFKRYIVTFALTLIMCTVLLGIALLYFSAQNFTDDKENILKNAAGRALVSASECMIVTDKGYIADVKLFDEFSLINESTGVTVFLTDAKGNVLVCTEGEKCIHNKQRVDERILMIAVKRGSYSSADYVDGFLHNRGSYIYGLPLYADGVPQAFVFTSSPITPLVSFLLDLLITFLVSCGAMLVCSSAIIFFATKRLTSPLREISVAAEQFGSGDFTARVAVDGDDEIANVGTAFNNMAESLSKFENQRRNFVASVSHDLRTPMTTIGGYIDGILDGTIPPARQKHYLEIVSDEVKRLSRLTSSLLDISRLEEGKMNINIENVNAWDVLLSVMCSAERRFAERSIKIPDLDVCARFVMCDSDMLYQALYNLVDNAIKFTPDGGTITVGIEADATRTEIRVRNSGDGIAPDELEKIFDRFYKTDKSRGLDKTGTGLGLYIVKTLVQRMGGEIDAKSMVGEYCEFTISLKTGIDGKAKQQKVRFNSSGIKSRRNFSEVPSKSSKNTISSFFRKER
ncbi:MAG: HAMP domain-containing sensor histidine kinase [Oscillospiraceae bacterium]